MAGSRTHLNPRGRHRLSRRVVQLILSLVLCFGAAYLGSRYTTPNITPWYESLAKPSFNPPNWIFGPVWSLLYTMMAISMWLIWKQGMDFWKVRVATVLFIIQLALNVLWSYAFFGMHWPVGGLIVICTLWLFVGWTMLAFMRLDKMAGAWLIPYLGWLSFALILNAAIVARN